MSFRAESSTSAADVDRILEQIRIVPDKTGVPGYQLITDRQENFGREYAELARAAGFAVAVRTKKLPGVPAGMVLGVTPHPGTMAPPGAVVSMTVTAEPDGPADEVSVGINSLTAAEDRYQPLDDAQIRAGATIELRVGDSIWAYAQGKRADTLAGDLDGQSLKVDSRKPNPNYPHSWVAVAPGRTTVTLTITAGGPRVVLGAVTVIVT